MAGPQAQRPISQHEGTGASRALRRPISMGDANVVDQQQKHQLHQQQNVHQTQHQQQQQLQHQQHVEIAVDDEDDETTNQTKDVQHSEKRVRHRHHRRPLYRRLISYIRNAWTAGVNFSSSNGNFIFFFKIHVIWFTYCVKIPLN